MKRLFYLLAHCLIGPLWWLVAYRRARQETTRKRVLFVVYNDLTARYVNRAALLLRGRSDIDAYVTRAPWVDRLLPTDHVLELVDARPISFFQAWTQWWDLIISADHYPVSLFHPAIRKLFVTHGLFAGKRFGKDNYVYGRRALRWSGKPVFHRMLASGFLEREFVHQTNPLLDDVVSIAGDTFADDLLMQRHARDEARDRLGIGHHEKMVVIMSSWGPDSLMQTIGQELLWRASELPQYRFCVTMHPNNYTRRPVKGLRLRQLVNVFGKKNLHLVGGEEPWLDYLLAADMYISDYTSLALYAALLGRPMIMTPVPPSDFLPQTPIRKLEQLTYVLKQPHYLSHALHQAPRQFDQQAMTKFADDLLAFPGQARLRLRLVMEELLAKTAEDAGRRRMPSTAAPRSH